jgi:SNF2 family DNA or RNA helicase
LFLEPRQIRPHLVVKGSGIDWFSVSTEWEIEGMKLTPADLQRLQTATGRFVKLPDAGWMELDSGAVQTAHETFADLGLDGLSTIPQKIGLEKAAHLDETGLQRFVDSPQVQALRKSLAEFTGIVSTDLPRNIAADLRPYQKDGFDFLCHLTRHKLGGILADDMGLGKTLQTLSWISWLHEQNKEKPKPALVICPASVLHNWRREAERFTPHLKVLVLESGAARHNLRQKIPQHDLIVTNYALLRRDLEALQKFSFRAAVLDEAQFIKNPEAQVTQSVKQINAEQRLALTGTPLENRLLDLWSIVDFVQPGFLGTQEQFTEKYEVRSSADRGNSRVNSGEEPPAVSSSELEARIVRKRLSAKLRPLMLRRLKRQVARDLPERIEERRDCELGEAQRKLYLAELRRSREQVMQTVSQKGLGKSTIHVLAALTRLRQICCHPQLVGNDSASGKTETLFELLEPLLADNQKVLVFSQFVQMLRLLEKECQQRNISTHILTGETKERQSVVNAFQNDPKGSVFLLSLRAAGTGLNLTTASYVVLYDPWWNPAVEAQAIDRSHRIGQTRTVNAYRLIAPGTVEEKIWDLQQRKAQTIADVLGEEGFARNLSQIDLEYLFSED